jgi:hypothetical protein
MRWSLLCPPLATKQLTITYEAATGITNYSPTINIQN